MKKLIAIDLDGTTLNTKSLISPRTEKVLKNAMNNGHYVSIVTGRPYRMSDQFYQQLGLTTPMVNFNGALVHIPNKQWAEETESRIQRDLVFDILAQKQALNLDFVAAENKETFYIDNFDYFDAAFFASEANEKNLLTTKNLVSDPTSMMVRTSREKAKYVSDTLTSQYGEYVDVRTWGGPTAILEIVSKGIQKAKGVEQVANYLNVKRSDILAFGDEHNDEEMLEYAGWGVAMKNATDHIKSVANDITEKTNEEDGLADYLDQYLDLQTK
ncbi:Cof-type HAD-IIB family hydrolase [Enterococcus rivorum]|uniref:Haloacid dehalogenase n=1 Tax=Enterococcus rivorum TaxID=762845 RepID=A0A1E5L057_9ENTE|nr:Cof-type HAD-IIB family hydrolase [Enterococcus rivorum]MBP2099329.1 Cof subfamily protein (haloacid dehalogenase superfamily) [Enterococcus rivorum]OEH83289.1 haloacid dehalogenase [Enterococcus rivorum]